VSLDSLSVRENEEGDMRIDSWLSFGIGLFAAASGIAAAMFLRSIALELRAAIHGAVSFTAPAPHLGIETMLSKKGTYEHRIS
jgi:hypothetical protein